MLVKNFVSRRGGGLLMLGGPDSLAAGKYDRTPIGSVAAGVCGREIRRGVAGSNISIASRSRAKAGCSRGCARGKTEPEERERLASMATFQVLSHVGSIKPAATVLAEVIDESGANYPALVTQRFGRGRSAALLIGDLWRWGLAPAERQRKRLGEIVAANRSLACGRCAAARGDRCASE